MKLPPLSPNPIRHCLGHLYPFAGNDLWKWHVRQLADRLPLFNGRVLLSVALGPLTVLRDEVLHQIPPTAKIDLRFVTNNSAIGERASFLWGLQELAPEIANPHALLFYWHSKGVSIRPGDPRHHYDAVRRWADSLWRTNCDCLPLVQEQLRTAAVTGSHRRPWPKSARTHYPGTFFWVRLAALAGRPWAQLDPDRWAVEKWPGQMFDVADTACLFNDQHDNHTGEGCLYFDHTWATVTPALRSFLATHSTNRSELGVIESGVGSLESGATLKPQSPSRPAPDSRQPTPDLPVDILITCGPGYDKYLDDAYASAVNQGGHLVIVFDNCAVPPKYQGLPGVVTCQHGFVQDAVREGLKHCRHPYVVRLDADNAMAEGYVQRAYQQLRAARQKDPRVALLYPEIHYFLEDWSPRPEYHQLIPKPWNYDQFQRANYIDAGSLVWRPALDSSWTVRATKYNHEDHFTWSQLFRAGWIGHPSDGVVLRYRICPGSMSSVVGRTYATGYALDQKPLTVFVPLSGRGWAWPALRDWLQGLPPQCRLVLADGSGDAAFEAMVRNDLGRFRDLSDVRLYRDVQGRPGLAVEDRHQTEAEVMRVVSRIYNRFAQECVTPLALIVEDDVLPDLPAGETLRRLLGGLDPVTLGVSGVYESRFDRQRLVAWTAGVGSAVTWVLRDQLAGAEYLPIQGSGFGCLLVRSEALRAVPHAIEPGEPWYDPRFFRLAAQQTGCGVKLATTVTCQHRDTP